MRTVKYKITKVDDRLWAWLSTCGEPNSVPVHQLLRWIVEQLNLRNFRYGVDDDGDITNVTIGSEAAPLANSTTVGELAAAIQDRVSAVSIAGLFARAREERIEVAHSAFAERVRNTAQQGARDNTALHYAFELIAILGRISQVSFVFRSPPIKSSATAPVVALLGEATRAYLFNLQRSCVSLCRALLEAVIRDHVDPDELVAERMVSKKGELECLIRVASRRNLLTSRLQAKAQEIRKAGNKALHGPAPGDADAWQVLLDTRLVVSAIYGV